jgi:hypothetical protein
MALLIAFLGVFIVGCSKPDCGEIKYGAVVLCGDIWFNEEYNSTIREDFIDNNLTRNPYFDPKIPGIINDNLPETITLIVKNQQELSEIFSTFPIELDFEKEMLVLYGFSTTTPNQIKIKKIDIENDALKINLIVLPSNPPNIPNASQPRTRWVIVKMDKLDILSVQVN